MIAENGSMASNVEQLEDEIRELSKPDQARLLAVLLETMRGEIAADSEHAWARESAERMRELQEGKTTARPLNEAIADIRSNVNART